MAAEDPGQTPTETVECSEAAYIIAGAIYAVADALQELAKAYSAEIYQEAKEPPAQFDMAGNPIA